MSKTIIQVPVTKTLRNRAALAAADFGFSSIQESIRVFLNQLAKKQITISFTPKSVQLSPRAIKRYNKIIDDIDSGKEPLYKAKNVKDLMDQLYGKKRPVRAKVS